MNLQQKTTHAVMWSAADIFIRQGINFLVVILLARLLAPEDFGTIAILTLFVAIATNFMDGGFSSALIQRQDTTSLDESTIFFFNIGMGTVAALILCAAAQLIAAFYKQTMLQNLTYAMAFNILVNAFGAIHIALLTKELQFKTIMKVGMVSSLVSGFLAIILAWRGFGAWSLVGQTLASSVISVILLWTWHAWRPKWGFSILSLRSLFRFGGYVSVTELIDVLYRNLNSVMIGKLYSIQDVGYYDRAQKTQLMPVNLMMGIINRVAYPLFSAAAEDKERLARGMRKALKLAMFVNIPVLISVIILARPLVITLFGSKWLQSVPLLQILGLVGILWPLHVLNLNVLKAQGRSDLFFRNEILKKTVAISLMVAASFHGILAIAWAQVIASTMLLFVNAYYTGIFLNYGGWAQLSDLTLNFAAAIPMACAIWLLVNLTDMPVQLTLAVSVVLGGTVYLATCRLVRLDALGELVAMIRPKR